MYNPVQYKSDYFAVVEVAPELTPDGQLEPTQKAVYDAISNLIKEGFKIVFVKQLYYGPRVYLERSIPPIVS